ncbi:MAG TPA: SpoIIE family protein phosphatase [Dermatophilaceae bacterium]|nr:SpoIIE family protein phosphatase [Dermatophilaceae bacterium]
MTLPAPGRGPTGPDDVGDLARAPGDADLLAWAVDRVDEGVIVLDRDWTVRYVNVAGAQLTSETPEQMTGRAFWDVFPAGRGTLFEESYERAWRTGEPQEFESYYPPLGTWYEVRALPVPDTLLLFFRDVNERRAAQQERAELVSSLQRAMDRGEALLALTSRLNGASTVQEVADSVTATVRGDVEAVFTGVALVELELEGRAMRYVSLDPLPPRTAESWTTFPLSRFSPVTDAARGHATFFEDVADAVVSYPHLVEDFATAGLQSIAHLPLESASGVIGTLAVGWDAPRAISSRERAFLTTVARYVGQALERARLAEAQAESVHRLQVAILPTSLPTVAGVDLAAVYHPAEQVVSVGGDWYDAVPLPDGTVALVVGDVTGHGVDAAAAMAQLRHTVRAYLLLGSPPDLALGQANAVALVGESPVLATVVVAVVDPVRRTVEVARAGHPPPLLITAKGARPLDPEDRWVGVMLGVAADAYYPSQRVDVEPGTGLLLYTDGVIERRDDSLSSGISRLVRSAEGSPDVGGDLGTLLAEVLDKVLDGRAQQDDVCAVLCRVGPWTDPTRGRPTA